MAAASSSKVPRVKGAVVEWPIVFGNNATWLGKKATDTATHRWCCYVRSADGRDLAAIVQKVVFNLHPSFPTPVITVEQAPFEINEVGWGEFEIRIELFFLDPAEKPVELFHSLKLFGDNEKFSKKPAVSEHFNEIVFNDPSEAFHKKLMAASAAAMQNHGLGKIQRTEFSMSPSMSPTSPFPMGAAQALQMGGLGGENYELTAIRDGQGMVRTELQKTFDRYNMIDQKAKHLTKEISQLEEEIARLQQGTQPGPVVPQVN